jgi:predicted amidohydrolase YtcJ
LPIRGTSTQGARIRGMPEPIAADLIIRGRIATLDGPPGTLGLVEAIAVADGRVIGAGDRDDLEAFIRPGTRELRLAPDEVALPGLTDGHLHIADAAVAAEQLDLRSAATLAEGLEVVRAAHLAVADSRDWLRGGGWDAGRWGGWPTATDLDQVAPGRRVLLWSIDLHSVWVSGSSMVAAGVTAATPERPGGVIRRLEDGHPAGVFHEDATHLVTAHAPMTGPDRLAELIERYASRMVALGAVAAHDPGEVETDSGLERGFAAIERLAAADRLPIRVHAGIRRGALDRAIERGLQSGDPLGPAEGRARVGWLKLFGDGTLGSRTAALLAPYEEDADRGEPPAGPSGMLVTDPADLGELAERAATHGIATQVHAIGDGALRAALHALEPTVGRTALRPRVEHVQLADPTDIAGFARLGIVASVQPADLRDDAAKARRAWGARSTNAYPWRRLVDSGAVVCVGSDAPAAADDPWPALAMAIARRDPDWPADAPAFGPADALTIGQALRAACVAAPIAAGERDRGQLSAGQRADLVVIPHATLNDPDALRVARPRLVLMDGRVVAEA